MVNISRLLLSIFTIFFIDFTLSKTEIPFDSNNYLFGFENFVRKAKQTRGQKRIILIGGSSLGMGVSAKNLSENLNVTTLNSGIDVNIGYSNYFKNVRDYVDKEKDILVISPEYDMGLPNNNYFYRSREFCEISLYVRKVYPFECIGYSLTKTLTLSKFFNKGREGYIKDGFNLNGDYIYRLNENLIKKDFRDICKKDINLKNIKKKYIPYFKKLREKGYKIVYIPNFIPEKYCSRPAQVKNFHLLLYKNFGVKDMLNAKLLFNEKYFYDYIYHLNKNGVVLKTKIFEEHLKKVMKD